MEAKFKYEDTVRVVNTNLVGECIDVIPYVVNGTIQIGYIIHTIEKGPLKVKEHQLEKYEYEL